MTQGSEHENCEVSETRCYRAFGFWIESEIELPDVPIGIAIPDLQVRIGKIPYETLRATNQGGDFSLNENEFWGRLEPTGRCLVRNGSEIIFEGIAKLDEAMILRYLFGHLLGAVCHQRGLLALHASTVCRSGIAILFCGASGAGKSTTAAFLEKYHQFALSNDDVTPIKFQNGTGYAMPGWPSRNLTSESISHLGETSTLIRPAHNNKFRCPVEDFQKDATPVGRIYILNPGGDHFEIKAVSGVKKVAALTDQIYFPRFLEVGGSNSRISGSLVALAKQAEVFEVKGYKSSLQQFCSKVGES